ncbi:MAG TPA: secretin N-terminal domain-containing protein [Terriglobia bacterium]|nr:secretin N-terminal domain-containing protein [Terriglobia bacterium]
MPERLRRNAGLAGLAGLLLASVGCNPGSVASRQARQAELRKDYDTAVIDYGKALQYEPQNSRYLIHQQDARVRAAEFHVKQGRQLLAENRPEAAAGEFEKAVGVDPTNETAKQELNKLLVAKAEREEARQKKLEQALKPKEEAPLTTGLKPFPTEPLAHFRISADSRKVFETLGKLSELNVAFNFDFQPRPISLDLSNVNLQDAMRAACYEAHAFWKAISPNTILIVPDTPTNRREYEDEVLKTIHLSNPLAPADRTQISTALKQVLGLQRIIDNPNSNSIIIRDTPDKVAAAEEMIHNLDLGKAEILIDVSVLEASRQRMQSLGISPVTISASGTATPGFQTAVTYAPPGTTTTSNGTTTTTTQSAPALNQLGKLSTADFAIALPSIAAQAILSDDHTRVLQNPEVRVTDGLTAKLRIGSRVPYATGSFLPSFGGATGATGTTGGIGLLASTQFQYQDVGVNLDITPHLTADGEIALHAKIEISSVGAPAQVGGLSQPTFNQRIIEHDIQLKEGEVSLLGGLIQTQTERSVAGLPGLAEIPLLRYLFSSVTNTTMDDEVLVMLDPHIIRLPDVPSSTESAVSEDGSPSPVPFALNRPGVPRR